MIKIEEKELYNIKKDIIKYLKRNKVSNSEKMKEMIKIIELALDTYIYEINKHNINNNNTK